jgi:predicted esterase YcpF (UPF0227 family)
VTVSRNAAPTHLLYLHGFRSSPRSFKAERLRGWLARHRPALHWWCPQLPPSPRAAMALVEAGLADWPAGGFAVCGSSLGGFYATVVAVRHGCRAVVINPAVDPARDLARHIGEQTAWHDPTERFFFRPEFVDELRTLAVPQPADLSRVLAIIAQGDEVLDWREMRARYQGARLQVVEGSDHALSDFDDHLPVLLDFLGLLDEATPAAGVGP